MATKSTVSVVSQANKAAKSMNAQLTTVLEEIRGMLQKVEAGSILARWEVGSRIAKVMEDESKYGEGAATKLSLALGIDEQHLYRCKNVAEIYAKDELQKLIERRGKTGRGITWSHLDELSRVPTAKARKVLTEMVFEQALPVSALKIEIQRKLGRRGKGKGRPRVGVKTPGGAIAVVARLAGNDSTIISDALPQLDKVLDAPSDYADDGFLEEVVEALAQAKASHGAFGALVKKLESVEQVAARVVRHQKQQAQADVTSSRATDRAAAKARLNGVTKKKKKKPLVVVKRKKSAVIAAAKRKAHA